MNRVRKIIDRYNSMSVVVKASLWATICGFLQKGISLLTTPIFTRIMTTEQYGEVTLYLSWISTIRVFTTLNVTYGGFHNGMVKYPDRREEYTSSVLFLTTVMNVVWCIVYWFARDMVNGFTGLSTLLTFLLFFEIASKAALDIWITRQRYDYKYKSISIVTIITSILVPVLGVVLVLCTDEKYNVIARISGFLIGYGGVGLVLYVYILIKGRKLIDLDFWKFTLKFNIPLIPHYLSQSVLNQFDRIMIGTMCGKAQAGIYGLAHNVGMLLNILTSAINSAFIPWVYRSMKAKEYKKIGKIANTILLLLFVLITCLMLFAPEIVLVLGSRKYYEAIYVVPPLAASVFFVFLFSLFVNIELYFEKNIFVMIGSVIVATINLVLNYFGIGMFGYLAAGYTTMISYALICIVHYYFMRRICRQKAVKQDIYNVRWILVMSVGIVCVSVFVTLTYHSIIIRYTMIASIIVGLLVKRDKLFELIKYLRKE